MTVNATPLSLSKQAPLEQLLALRLELESKRRQETELKVRDSGRLFEKISKLGREQENRERVILDLRQRLCKSQGVHDRGSESDILLREEIASQLAVAERTVRLLDNDITTLQKNYAGLKADLHQAHQELLGKRLEVTRLQQNNLELDGKVGKLEKKLKESWSEEDKLMEELYEAGDKIAGFEQDVLDSGLESFNKAARFEEELRVMQVFGICRQIALETVIDAVDLAARINRATDQLDSL